MLVLLDGSSFEVYLGISMAEEDGSTNMSDSVGEARIVFYFKLGMNG
jgi:hypothetical protein